MGIIQIENTTKKQMGNIFEYISGYLLNHHSEAFCFAGC